MRAWRRRSPFTDRPRPASTGHRYGSHPSRPASRRGGSDVCCPAVGASRQRGRAIGAKTRARSLLRHGTGCSHGAIRHRPGRTSVERHAARHEPRSSSSIPGVSASRVAFWPPPRPRGNGTLPDRFLSDAYAERGRDSGPSSSTSVRSCVDWPPDGRGPTPEGPDRGACGPQRATWQSQASGAPKPGHAMPPRARPAAPQRGPRIGDTPTRPSDPGG